MLRHSKRRLKFGVSINHRYRRFLGVDKGCGPYLCTILAWIAASGRMLFANRNVQSIDAKEPYQIKREYKEHPTK